MRPNEVLVMFSTPEQAARFCKAVEANEIAWGPDWNMDDWADEGQHGWVAVTDHKGEDH